METSRDAADAQAVASLLLERCGFGTLSECSLFPASECFHESRNLPIMDSVS